MKKAKIIVSLIAVLLFLFSMSAGFIYASSEQLVKAEKDTALAEVLEKSDYYYVDAEEMSILEGDAIAMVFNSFTNGIFSFEKLFSELQVSILDFAIDFSLFELISDTISPLFNQVKAFMFKDIYKVGIVAMGVYLMWLLLRRRTTQVISEGLQTIAVIVCTLIFFAMPMTLLQQGSDLTKEISSGLFLTSGDVKSKDTATDKAVRTVWAVLVEKPWEVLEFNDAGEIKKYKDKVLKYKADTEERQDVIDDIADETEQKVEAKELDNMAFSKTAGTQIAKFALVLVLLLFEICIFIILMCFCLLIIGYQFFAVLLAFAGGFVFILALFPRFGMQMVGRWAGRLLFTYFVTVLLMFFLSLLLMLMTWAYGLSARYGILVVFVLLVSLVVIMIVKRDEILGLFAKVGSGGGVRPAVDNMLTYNPNAIAMLQNSQGVQNAASWAGQKFNDSWTANTQGFAESGNMRDSNAGGSYQQGQDSERAAEEAEFANQRVNFSANDMPENATEFYSYGRTTETDDERDSMYTEHINAPQDFTETTETIKRPQSLELEKAENEPLVQEIPMRQSSAAETGETFHFRVAEAPGPASSYESLRKPNLMRQNDTPVPDSYKELDGVRMRTPDR